MAACRLKPVSYLTAPDCGQSHERHTYEPVMYVQVTYSDDGVFITTAVFCGFEEDAAGISTLFALSKEALYGVPPVSTGAPSFKIYAAVYLAATSWFRSLPVKEQYWGAAAGYTPFNNFIQPARPQDPADMSEAPLFVMKVGHPS